jgi:hypothetical protein
MPIAASLPTITPRRRGALELEQSLKSSLCSSTFVNETVKNGDPI